MKKNLIAVLAAISFVLVAFSGEWPPLPANASGNVVRFIQQDGTPFPLGTTISITAHGTISPVIGSGTINSTGYLTPNPTLVQGTQYDFTSSFATVPSGTFFAQSSRVVTVVVGGGGPTTLPCPSPGANITVSGTFPCTIAASGAITAATPNVAGNLIAAASPGPYTLIVPTPVPGAGSCISVTGVYPYTFGYTCATPYPTPVPTSANTNCSFASYTLTCATPTPAPTPSPGTGNTNCAWSGLYPYTITCTTPAPTTAPLPTFAASSPVVFATPLGVYTYSCPLCVTSTPTPGPSLPLSVANGGTGTSTPSLVASTCIGITGTFPAQSIAYSCASPTPEPSPVAGNCISLSGLAAPYGIAYSCASPTPQPSPIAGSCINVSGLAAPYTVAYGCATPYPTPVPTSANANCSFSAYTLTCSTPTPMPTPFVLATATAAPSLQSAYAYITGLQLANGLGIDGNLAPTNGIACGTVNTVNCKIVSAGGLTTTKPFQFNYSTACALSSDDVVQTIVNSATKTHTTCNGDLYATSFNGSGAGLALGTVPNAALVTSPSSGNTNCTWGGTAGYTITCTTPAPSAGSFTNLVCTGVVTCSPSAGPTPSVNVAQPTSGNANCSWASLVITCTTPAPVPTPSPAVDPSGVTQTGFHTVVLAGVLPATTSTACHTGGAAVACNTYTLTGNSVFSSGGSASTAPSFECGGMWYYYGPQAIFIAITSATVTSSSYLAVRIVAGTPNTIYVTSSTASSPYYIVCQGT